MGRDVAIRVSYYADATYMTKLARAVEKDRRIPPDERRAMLGHIHGLTGLFIKEDQRRTTESADDAAKYRDDEEG